MRSKASTATSQDSQDVLRRYASSFAQDLEAMGFTARSQAAQLSRVRQWRMGAAARRVPRFQLPDWVVRFAGRRDPTVRSVVPQLGLVRRSTGEKARRVLGWAPRSNGEAIVATAESLVRLGLLDRGPRAT